MPPTLPAPRSPWQVMNYLLGVGADVLESDTYGNTALHYAAFKGHLELLGALLGRKEADGGGDNTQRCARLIGGLAWPRCDRHAGLLAPHATVSHSVCKPRTFKYRR